MTDKGDMIRMPKYSVKKPMTVFVVIVIIIALGVVSLLGMTPDLMPSIDLPYVVVMTTYPGATPKEVETSVTKPLEQGLAKEYAVHIGGQLLSGHNGI